MKTGLHVEGFGATVKSFPCMRTASFLDFLLSVAVAICFKSLLMHRTIS